MKKFLVGNQGVDGEFESDQQLKQAVKDKLKLNHFPELEYFDKDFNKWVYLDRIPQNLSELRIQGLFLQK